MGVAKKIRKLLSRSAESNNFPTVGGITFIHHLPTTPNLGDHLCSPRHYFHLDPARPDLCILGGGVYAELGQRKLREIGISPSRTVVWGVGQSAKPGAGLTKEFTDLPFLEWSTRDRALAPSEERFVPCVSCHHPMLDAPCESEDVLVFLNADRRVTPPRLLEACRRVAALRGWRVVLNSCDTETMTEALGECRRIVTNSYHGAYWGLLAGREVRLAGYSTKFRSLFASLGLAADPVVPIAKGDSKDLVGFIEESEAAGGFSSLPDPRGTLERARACNTAFADRLCDRGIILSYQLRDFGGYG